MRFRSRLPIAAVCLGLGVVGGIVATNRLHGQPVKPPAERKDTTSFRDVVKTVVPAVVSIKAKSTVAARADDRTDNRRPAPPLPPGVPDEFRRFFEMVPRDGTGRGFSDPSPSPDLGMGSGVLISKDGVVLTNYHVVEDAESVEVTLDDGRTFTSKDIRRDAKSDLAVVKLDGGDKPFPFLAFADSDAAEVGDRVLAAGAPFGLTGSVTHGIISAKSRQNLRLNQYEDFVQTDAAINPGNSGGPLVDMDGKIVGINSAIKTRSGGFQGVGLAISSNLARDVADQLMDTGVVRRGYLGVGIRALTDELADRFGVPAGGGVVVTKVYAGSPAEKAGLKAGDVVTKVGDKGVTNLNALPRLVAKLPVGKPSDFRYVRDGEPAVATIIIEEQPETFGTRTAMRPAPTPADPPAKSDDDYGLSVATLTPNVASRIGVPRDTAGVVVESVDRTGPAADAGLTTRQVITKVDKTAVTTADEFLNALKAADPDRGALLHVMRPGGEVDFAVLKVK